MNKRQVKGMKSYHVNTEDDETSDDSSYSNARIHRFQGKREQHDRLERKRHHSIKESFDIHKESMPPLKLQRSIIKDEETSDDDDSSCSNTRIHHDRDKREHHNCLERKRRQTIKEAFDMLRDSIPPLRGQPGRVSRSQILKGGSEHIVSMKEVIYSKKEEITNMTEENNMLENEIKSLEMERSNQQKYKASLNGSSSVSSKRTLSVPSNLSSKIMVNNSSDLCLRKSVNRSSVQIYARNDENPLYSLNSNNSIICSNSSRTETGYSLSSNSAINNNGTSSSGSEAEADNESAYSSSANIDSDFWSFQSVRAVNLSKNVRSLFDLDEDFVDFGNRGNDPSLTEICLETADNSSYLNSPRNVDAISSNVLENIKGKGNSNTCSRRLVRIDSEDNENNRNVGNDATLNRFLAADYDNDDNFSCGFDIHSLKSNPIFENIPSYEDSIDFTFDDNFLEVDNSQACPKPPSRFSK